MATYLDEIVAWHRNRAGHDERTIDNLLEQAATCGPTRSILPALGRPSLSVIAEVKRHSPSKGSLSEELDPVALACAYEEGGAAAISVLTDREFFHGSLEDLKVVRSKVKLPLLRKDFTVDARDVCDARIAGADLILLICTALSDRELKEFSVLAHELGLEVLFEVHDEHDLERACALDPKIVGINQRDLRTFDVDTERAQRMVHRLPTDVFVVAESGLSSPSDAAVLAAAGFDGVLVGEHFVRAVDPQIAVAEFASVATTPRRSVLAP